MDPSNESSLNDEFAQAIDDFTRMLDGETPSLFITNSLTSLLRTESPVLFGAERVAGIVADWAERRAEVSGERMSDLMVHALRSIVDAHKMNAISHFNPKAFYRPFVAALLERCPESEQDGLDIALRTMRSGLPERSQIRSTAEYETRATVVFRGETMTREAALAALLEQIEVGIDASNEEFDEDLNLLRDLLLSPSAATPTETHVRRLVVAALTRFNAGEVSRASRLFEIVEEALPRTELNENRQLYIRKETPISSLDERILVTWINDPGRRAQVIPIVRYFADLEPTLLLNQLVHEKDLLRVRLLRNFLALRGEGAHTAVLDRLSASEMAGTSLEYTALLLDLLADLGTSDRVARRRAASLAGRYVTHEHAPLRSIAMRALDRIGNPDAAPYALMALTPSAYGTIPQKQELIPHLEVALRILADSDAESTLVAVVEVATGARGAEFKLGRELRELTATALAARSRPLPRRAALVAAKELRELLGRKLKLVTGSLRLGIDTQACLSLMRVIENSPEPEVREVLENSTLRKIASKAT